MEQFVASLIELVLIATKNFLTYYLQGLDNLPANVKVENCKIKLNANVVVNGETKLIHTIDRRFPFWYLSELLLHVDNDWNDNLLVLCSIRNHALGTHHMIKISKNDVHKDPKALTFKIFIAKQCVQTNQTKQANLPADLQLLVTNFSSLAMISLKGTLLLLVFFDLLDLLLRRSMAERKKFEPFESSFSVKKEIN